MAFYYQWHIISCALTSPVDLVKLSHLSDLLQRILSLIMRFFINYSLWEIFLSESDSNYLLILHNYLLFIIISSTSTSLVYFQLYLINFANYTLIFLEKSVKTITFTKIK